MPLIVRLNQGADLYWEPARKTSQKHKEPDSGRI